MMAGSPEQTPADFPGQDASEVLGHAIRRYRGVGVMQLVLAFLGGLTNRFLLEGLSHHSNGPLVGIGVLGIFCVMVASVVLGVVALRRCVRATDFAMHLDAPDAQKMALAATCDKARRWALIGFAITLAGLLALAGIGFAGMG